HPHRRSPHSFPTRRSSDLLLDIWPKLKAPVWMTPFSAGLLAAKRQGEQGAPKVPVTVFRGGEKFSVGPFEIEAIPVAHSIPEPRSEEHTSELQSRENLVCR